MESCSLKNSFSFFEIRLKGILPLDARRYARDRFSSMVIWGAVPFKGSWKRRPMIRLLWYSGAKVMSFPFKVMEPESVIKLPAMAANMVDFPAPLEPMTVAKSPGSR